MRPRARPRGALGPPAGGSDKLRTGIGATATKRVCNAAQADLRIHDRRLTACTYAVAVDKLHPGLAGLDDELSQLLRHHKLDAPAEQNADIRVRWQGHPAHADTLNQSLQLRANVDVGGRLEQVENVLSRTIETYPCRLNSDDMPVCRPPTCC